LTTLNKKPSLKIYALSFAALLVIVSAVYLKFFSPTSKNNGGVLLYENKEETNPIALALQAELLKAPTPDNAFSSKSFSPDDNLSQRFAKTAFASYVNLSEAGISEGAVQGEIISSMVNKANNVSNPDIYTLTDLTVFTPTDKESIRSYGNAFISVILKNFEPYKDKKNTYLKNIEATATIYEQIARDLSKLSVPKEIAATHLKETNNYNKLASNFRDISNYPNDPLRGLVAIKEAQQIEQTQKEDYTILSKYFKDNGIIFNKDEPGYHFTPTTQ
jgi:hypothetical protein